MASQSCFDCGKPWIDFDGNPVCPWCTSPVTSTPVFISHVRRALEVLDEELFNGEVDARTAETRARLLEETWLKHAPVIESRLAQMYHVCADELREGKTGEDVLSRLTLTAFGCLELGLPTAAAAIAGRLMLTLGLRHYDLARIARTEETAWLHRLLEAPGLNRNPLYFKLLLRLSDVTRALQWAQFLQLPGWEAFLYAVAGATTLRDSRILAGVESLPFRAVALHHLDAATHLARANNYFYLMPWLSRMQTDLYQSIVTLADEGTDPLELGERLQDRLTDDWLVSGRREALAAAQSGGAPPLSRFGWLGPEALDALWENGGEVALREVTGALDGLDRRSLQWLMDHGDDPQEAFAVHDHVLDTLITDQFQRLEAWISHAQAGSLHPDAVRRVIVEGLREDRVAV